MNPDLTRIADKVRGLASERRVNQTEVARVLGTTRQAVNARMNGRVPFAAWELQILAREFGVPAGYFFGEVAA